MHKRYGDSFEDTDLEDVLAAAGVGHLVVAGAQTDECIRSTIHGAFTRGYDVTLVGDAHTTEDLTEYGAPPPAQVIAHTNLYWKYHSAPGRTAGVADTAEVSFAAARAPAHIADVVLRHRRRRASPSPWSSLGPLPRKASTAACESQRSKTLMRPGSTRSALMAKSRHPVASRACSTTLTHPARYESRCSGATVMCPATMTMGEGTAPGPPIHRLPRTT